MLKKVLIIICFFFVYGQACPQAGNAVYSFLDLPISSRQAALGSSNVSLRDNDINFALMNPALLTQETKNTIGVNIANYLSDITFGSAIYGYSIDDKSFMAVGMQYVDYGKFDGRDDLDSETGLFSAKDMSLSVVYARTLTNRITVGATLKPVFSVFEMYTSFGMAADLGVSYRDTTGNFSAGFVLRNIGTQLKGYYADEDGQHYERLPFNVMLGVSKKLEHAPFRFSLTLHNLQRWNLSYLTDDSDDDDADAGIGFFDMAFRHAIIGVEFVPGKNFYLAASYNHRRSKELAMSGFKSMSGFSFGGGVKLYKFQIGFGLTPFQTGITAYQFSISTSLKEFGL
ncbi:MAG: hypothetical protein H6Q20_643 [Bacteroidetes bacterium]|nr:hypothetical protein [Bacteroidota bacterium]